MNFKGLLFKVSIVNVDFMRKINLGCGYRLHSDWINVDFIKTGSDVIVCNLLDGIPFEDQSADVIYHSHVLEHFSRGGGEKFILECFRVLKPGGIIRIAVPDLEEIAKGYVNALEMARNGEKGWDKNYDWMVMEMFDQTVRTFSGGEMAQYLEQEIIDNEEFVFSRWGEEARNLRDSLLSNKKLRESTAAPKMPPKRVTWKRFFTIQYYLRKLKDNFFREESEILRTEKRFVDIGKFRSGGELHQWMYDSYSLSRLLERAGFESPEEVGPMESRIPNWISYELDANKQGKPHKPDSLFMEASKPQ